MLNLTHDSPPPAEARARGPNPIIDFGGVPQWFSRLLRIKPTFKMEQLGFLTMNEEGAVLNSGGELDNDERIAGVIYNMVNISKRSLGPTGTTTNFNRITISYSTHWYHIVLSNKRYHVIKKRYLTNEPAMA